MSWQRAAAAAIVIAAVCFLIARGNSYQTFIIVLVGLTAIVGIGLNVLLGLNGQISLGHAAFYAFGAYAVGILTTTYEWSFWLALAVSGAVSGSAGALLAIPALRVRGPYLAMVTIAFGFVVEQSAAEWQGLTGGWNGLSGIPVRASSTPTSGEGHRRTRPSRSPYWRPLLSRGSATVPGVMRCAQCGIPNPPLRRSA